MTTAIINFTGAFSRGLSAQAFLSTRPWRIESSNISNEAVPIRHNSTAGDADSNTTDDLATEFIPFPSAASCRPAQITEKVPPWHLGPIGIKDDEPDRSKQLGKRHQ